MHSVLSGAALAEWAVRTYDLDAGLTGALFARTLNDTYFLSLPSQAPAYALRVYRSVWRSAEAVAWELDLLAWAAGRGAAVAESIPTLAGQSFEVVQAPEGPRVLALFKVVTGRPLATTAADGALYGEAAAQLHQALDDFSSPHARFSLGLAHLIDEPLRALEPFLSAEQFQELSALGLRLRAALEALSPDLTWAACHGDLHTGNVLFGEDGRVRFFDFDCAGMGWRAYDLAVYWWDWAFTQNLGGDGQPGEAWTAFLDAYQRSRPLSAAEEAALPWFVAARTVWFMGLMVGRVDETGRRELAGLFDYALSFLRSWERAWLR